MTSDFAGAGGDAVGEDGTTIGGGSGEGAGDGAANAAGLAGGAFCRIGKISDFAGVRLSAGSAATGAGLGA